ncbi:hypothetical protein TNCV_2477431 [Trichonephila clavipes]|nr:hypothetical protein TNCV_2477431 [Trichonephila clavipes]
MGASGVKWWAHDSFLVTIRKKRRCHPHGNNVVDDLLRKVDDMIKANRRNTINVVAEELGIKHGRVQKTQSPEFFLEGFLKLIKRYGKCPNELGTYVEK